MLEVWVHMCSRAHAIVQWIALGSNSRASATSYMRDEAGIAQAALVVLRLRCSSAIVLPITMQRALLGVRVRAVVLAAADAEEVLDLLAGGIVHLAIAVQAGPAEDSLAGAAVRIGGDSRRHVGGDATAALRRGRYRPPLLPSASQGDRVGDVDVVPARCLFEGDGVAAGEDVRGSEV